MLGPVEEQKLIVVFYRHENHFDRICFCCESSNKENEHLTFDYN